MNFNLKDSNSNCFMWSITGQADTPAHSHTGRDRMEPEPEPESAQPEPENCRTAELQWCLSTYKLVSYCRNNSVAATPCRLRCHHSSPALRQVSRTISGYEVGSCLNKNFNIFLKTMEKIFMRCCWILGPLYMDSSILPGQMSWQPWRGQSGPGQSGPGLTMAGVQPGSLGYTGSSTPGRLPTPGLSSHSHLQLEPRDWERISSISSEAQKRFRMMSKKPLYACPDYTFLYSQIKRSKDDGAAGAIAATEIFFSFLSLLNCVMSPQHEAEQCGDCAMFLRPLQTHASVSAPPAPPPNITAPPPSVPPAGPGLPQGAPGLPQGAPGLPPGAPQQHGHIQHGAQPVCISINTGNQSFTGNQSLWAPSSVQPPPAAFPTPPPALTSTTNTPTASCPAYPGVGKCITRGKIFLDHRQKPVPMTSQQGPDPLPLEVQINEGQDTLTFSEEGFPEPAETPGAKPGSWNFVCMSLSQANYPLSSDDLQKTVLVDSVIVGEPNQQTYFRAIIGRALQLRDEIGEVDYNLVDFSVPSRERELKWSLESLTYVLENRIFSKTLKKFRSAHAGFYPRQLILPTNPKINIRIHPKFLP